MGIFFSFITQISGFAEKINTDKLIFGKMRFSPTENPVTYNYFVEYADMLRSKVDFKKYKRYWLASYRYKVHTDGTISDLKNDTEYLI